MSYQCIVYWPAYFWCILLVYMRNRWFWDPIKVTDSDMRFLKSKMIALLLVIIFVGNGFLMHVFWLWIDLVINKSNLSKLRVSFSEPLCIRQDLQVSIEQRRIDVILAVRGITVFGSFLLCENKRRVFVMTNY